MLIIIVILFILLVNTNGYRHQYHHHRCHSRSLLKCHNDKIKKTTPLVNNDDNDNDEYTPSSSLSNIFNDQETYAYVTNSNTKLSSYMKRKRKEPKAINKFSWQLKAPTSVINGTLAGNHHYYHYYHNHHHHYYICNR